MHCGRDKDRERRTERQGQRDKDRERRTERQGQRDKDRGKERGRERRGNVRQKKGQVKKRMTRRQATLYHHIAEGKNGHVSHRLVIR